MGKFDGVLICTDLDGTLLDSSGEISKENIDAIEYFKANGGLFTFITGRPCYVSTRMYDAVKPNIAIGCLNGGGVYDFESGEYLWINPMPPDVTELLGDVERELPQIGFFIPTDRRIIFSRENCEMENFRERTGIDGEFCHYDEITEPISKIVFGHHEEKELLKLIEFLNNHPRAEEFEFVRSEATFYEVMPKGTTKAKALNKIVELYNLDKNKTVAIGDFDNDIEMIKTAKVGVAVKNACENAKAVADMITVSNDENAVARLIYDIENEIIQLG